MIYDVIPFLNEFDVLEIRLAELAGVVDKHVIVEYDMTFSGRAKRYRLHEKIDRYREFASRIESWQLTDGLPMADALARETFQRRGMATCINPLPDDIIIWTDADEIPRANIIERFKGGIADLRMTHHCGSCDWEFVRGWWDDGKILDGKTFLPLRDTFDTSIADPSRYNQDEDSIDDAGWHIAYTGNGDALLEKIGATGHFEHPDVVPLVEGITAGRRMVEIHPSRYRRCVVDLPVAVQQDKEKWRGKGLIEYL